MTTQRTLYQRLGETAGITSIVNTVIDLHMKNAKISRRFDKLQEPAYRERIARGTVAFFSTGTGGPATYTGKSMPDVHKGMNLSGDDFLAAVDDVMAALGKHNIDQQSQMEVLFTFYSLKDEVLRK